MVSIITPVHKIKYIDNSINNFLRQNYIDKELVLILNGECLGYNKTIICNNIHILKTDSNNISTIRNIGLDWSQKNNRKIFSCFDSDDFYGSNYLTEAYNKLIEGYKLVGKLNYTATYNDDEYKITGLIEDGIVHGPTITGYITSQRYNEQYYNLAEDIEYISKFGKNEIGYTSENNWKYSIHYDSIQHRSLDHFLEGIKFHNTQFKNINCKIYKNGILYWEYGNGYDLNKLSNHTQFDVGDMTKHHLNLFKMFKNNELM
jgi:hypothetical protein